MERSRPLLRDLNPHLICTLCGGYFIDATTIVECLHSFCRSCVVRHLQTSKFCPICDVQVHKTKPLSSIRRDPTLQTLVYKIVPGLYQNEQKRRRDFEVLHQLPQRAESPGAILSPEDSVSLQLRYHDDTLTTTPAPHRRYLRCPAAVSVRQLQRFVRLKYGLVDKHRVDIIYQGECLPTDFTLIDVAYTFHWKRTSPMLFTYRIFECAPKGRQASCDEPTPKKARLEATVTSESAPRVAIPHPEDMSVPSRKHEEPAAAASPSPPVTAPAPPPPPTPTPEKPAESKGGAASFAPESIADDFNEDDDDDDEFTLRISSSEEEEQQQQPKPQPVPQPLPEPEPAPQPLPEPEPEPAPQLDPEPAPALPVDADAEAEAEGRRSRGDAGRTKEKKRSKHKSKHHQRGEDGGKKRKTHGATPTILQYDEDAIKLKVKLSSPTSPSAGAAASNTHKHHHHHHHSKHHHSRHHKQGDVSGADGDASASAPKADVLLPPSSITVSKVDPADRRKGETKRPALEITLVNAPKKSATATTPPPLRPPAGLTITPKVQPKKDDQPIKHDDIGALDLSGKSSRTHLGPGPGPGPGPEVAPPTATAKSAQQSILSIAHSLVHRQLQGLANGGSAPAAPALTNLKTLSDAAVHIRNMMAAQGKANGCVRPPAARSPFGSPLPPPAVPAIRIPVPPKTAPRSLELYAKPNQAVRHIPNPSALVFRQQPYQASSIRKMENMTRNIEKVAAGLQMRAVEANVTK